MRKFFSLSILLLAILSVESVQAGPFRRGGGGFFQRWAQRRAERRVPNREPQQQQPQEVGGDTQPAGQQPEQIPTPNPEVAHEDIVPGGPAPGENPGGRPANQNPIQTKSFGGLPERMGTEEPKLADSAFVGKACHTRDYHIGGPETQENIQDLLGVHPNIRVNVKPWKAGATLEIAKGPYKIFAKLENPIREGMWQGGAHVEALTGEPDPAKGTKSYDVPLIRLETSSGEKGEQIQTLTFMVDEPTKTQRYNDRGDTFDVTEEDMIKVSSDGHYIEYSVFKDAAEKIVGYNIRALCGDRFTGGGELDVNQFFDVATPAKTKALESLIATNDDAPKLPAIMEMPKPKMGGNIPSLPHPPGNGWPLPANLPGQPGYTGEMRDPNAGLELPESVKLLMQGVQPSRVVEVKDADPVLRKALDALDRQIAEQEAKKRQEGSR